MRPDHDLRRRVIREWMLLPRNRRRTIEQAEEFAAKVLGANTLAGRADPHRRVMAWLTARMARG